MSVSHPSARQSWVDVARGWGILLVVYGHVLRGFVTAGIIAPSPLTALQDKAIYGFHMPLFFFLAGLWIERGVASGRLRFLRNKILTIAYPYILWSLVEGFITLSLSQYTNNGMSLDAIVAIGWAPIHHFWFLYALFICDVLAAIFLPRAMLLLLLAIIGIAGFVPGPPIFHVALFELIFVLAGVQAARLGISRVVEDRRAMILLMVGGWLAYAALFIIAWRHSALASQPWCVVLLAAFGIAGSVGMSGLLRHRAPFVAMLGRASMTIYILHTLVSSGARIMIEHLLPSVPPALFLLLCMAVGVLIPYWLHERLKHSKIFPWLGLGKRENFIRKAPAEAR